MLTGKWENFEELESKISLPELEALILAIRKKEGREQEFLAALKGINLKEGQSNSQSKFDEVKARAEARLAGVDEETKFLTDIGFGVE